MEKNTGKKSLTSMPLLKYKAINPEELELIHYYSEPREAFSFLKENLAKFL